MTGELEKLFNKRMLFGLFFMPFFVSGMEQTALKEVQKDYWREKIQLSFKVYFLKLTDSTPTSDRYNGIAMLLPLVIRFGKRLPKQHFRRNLR